MGLKSGFLLAILIMGLSACSSSSDTITEPSESAGQSDPLSGQLDDETQNIADSNDTTDPDTTDGPDTNQPTDPDTSGGTDTNQTTDPDNNDGTGTTDPAEQDPDTSGNQEPDNSTDPDTADTPIDMLVPDVAPDSDLGRLINGVTRQASLTLLSLNQRLSSGETLTQQEEDCLGTYDPAVGEQLLAVNCALPLAVGSSTLAMAVASFYDTDACHGSVFDGNTDNCQLQSASVRVPIEWTTPENGVPQPIYPGSTIMYAIDDDQILRIESLTDVNGAFRCDVDLNDVSQSSTPVTGQSCSDIIKTAADRIESLLPQE